MDASLVMRFFCSENELFAAAMSVPPDAYVWEQHVLSAEPLMAMLCADGGAAGR